MYSGVCTLLPLHLSLDSSCTSGTLRTYSTVVFLLSPTTTDKKREKQIKTLKAKVEIAKFLQATLKGGVESSETDDEVAAAAAEVQVDDFISFLQQAQTSGKPVKNEDIMKYSALFENEITLDNLQRPQLIALCQLLELQPMGTNNFLRFQIRMQLRSLKADDR